MPVTENKTSLPFRATDLSVALQGNLILENINLQIAPGTTVALCGENGSGKSTLVRAAVGLNPISSGSLEIFDAHPGEKKYPKALAKVGYVPQRKSALGTVPATALEVVRSGLLRRGHIGAKRSDRERALKALRKVGLAEAAGKKFQFMSGGQQQRVLIARALVRDPEFLIMDEPLAGIDRQSAQSLAATIAEAKTTGKTMLIVLHEHGFLAPLIDRTITLKSGRIASDSLREALPPLPRAKGKE
ncbi:metal ABC transporter ATP-binding protein [Varibaculum vaginae]|uniref:metal ABC transporter ATP-binding protein n=1 Tax=Varibaculum vaginae TaxID=2364797 RepID=UPI000F07CCB6|nr:ATP-binding cassette domain-containing protein [Varibaculum vaginae]